MFQRMLQGGSGGTQKEIELVPQMISDTEPEGVAIGNAYGGQYQNFNAFDKNSATEFCSSSISTGQYVGYNAPKRIKVTRLYFKLGNSSKFSHTISVQCSEDGTNWINTGTTFTVTDEANVDVLDWGYHKYWRVICIAATNSTRMYTKELQFYGFKEE